MGLGDNLREMLGGSDGGKVYGYRCRDCEEVFESPEVQIFKVACPACGSNDVRDHVA